jgi:hypothetical protein
MKRIALCFCVIATMILLVTSLAGFGLSQSKARRKVTLAKYTLAAPTNMNICRRLSAFRHNFCYPAFATDLPLQTDSIEQQSHYFPRGKINRFRVE